MHLARRLRQPSHVLSVGAVNVHRIFRRLHSQQLCVPLRIFRLLGEGVFAMSMAVELRIVPASNVLVIRRVPTRSTNVTVSFQR